MKISAKTRRISFALLIFVAFSIILCGNISASASAAPDTIVGKSDVADVVVTHEYFNDNRIYVAHVKINVDAMTNDIPLTLNGIRSSHKITYTVNTPETDMPVMPGIYDVASNTFVYGGNTESVKLASAAIEPSIEDVLKIGYPILENSQPTIGAESRTGQMAFVGTNGDFGDLWFCIVDTNDEFCDNVMSAYDCAQFLLSKGCQTGMLTDIHGTTVLSYHQTILNDVDNIETVFYLG